MHPGVLIALPPPALRQRCAGHCDGMLIPASPGHSSPALSSLKGSRAMWLLLSVSGFRLKAPKAPQCYQPCRTAAKNDILGILWRWGDLKEQNPGCEEGQSKGQAHNGRSSGKGKRGRGGSGGERKKEKPHATQEDSRAGWRRRWRKHLEETSTQTWHCQSSWILFGIRLCERKRGNI